MFGKSNGKAVASGMTDTLIGKGTILEGKIVSDAGLRIEGQINGDIECAGDVTIGETGVAQSNIMARNVINAGTIEGSVVTEGRMVLASTGKMFGIIQAASLNIAEGALFQGTSMMEPKPQTAAKAPDAKAADGKSGDARTSDAIPLKAKGDKEKANGKEKAQAISRSEVVGIDGSGTEAVEASRPGRVGRNRAGWRLQSGGEAETAPVGGG